VREKAAVGATKVKGINLDPGQKARNEETYFGIGNLKLKYPTEHKSPNRRIPIDRPLYLQFLYFLASAQKL
jgi:hypothetical protein